MKNQIIVMMIMNNNISLIILNCYSVMVKILEIVYKQVVQTTPLVPPETGGILGVNYKNIITEYYQDFGTHDSKDFCYIPNVDNFNLIINMWYQKGIQFVGIYHSHNDYDTTLSFKDIKYIKDILISIRDITNILYFPLVFPTQKMIFFKAEMYNTQVNISIEDFKII